MKIIFVADTGFDILKAELAAVGHVIELPPVKSLYKGIRNHVDLHLHIMDQKLFISKEIAPFIQDKLNALSVPFTIIDEFLGTVYPETIYLNALTTKDFFLHHTTTVAKKLAAYAASSHRKEIQVKQGYVRCTTLPLSETVWVTSDPNIYASCQSENLSLTFIRTGFIKLEGHAYGFIGGTGGVIHKTLYLNGDPSKHPDFPLIKACCEQLNLRIFFVPRKPLTDIGGILYLEGDES